MTRGVAHSAQLRGEVVAAILAGASVSAVAAQFGVSKSLVSEWANADIRTVRTDQRARDPEAIGELLLDLIATHVTTIQAQLQAASRADWLEKQSAAELAQLVAVERDTTIRLLAGLRVDEPEPLGLPEPADAAPDAGPDPC